MQVYRIKKDEKECDAPTQGNEHEVKCKNTVNTLSLCLTKEIILFYLTYLESIPFVESLVSFTLLLNPPCLWEPWKCSFWTGGVSMDLGWGCDVFLIAVLLCFCTSIRHRFHYIHEKRSHHYTTKPSYSPFPKIEIILLALSFIIVFLY